MKSGEAELEGLADHLRARVAEGRYPEAREALAEYCQTLRKTLACLRPDDPGIGRLHAQWQRLFEETRRRVLAGRAHARARLARLAQAPKLLPHYGGGPPMHRTREWSA